jgi:hypothetical protein
VGVYHQGTLATSKFIKQNINFYLESALFGLMVWRNFKSPYIGVTKAGTQRVVYASSLGQHHAKSIINNRTN